jgi:hypothetical protein
MTTINTFQDILDAMERNPALRDAMRRHILTEELIQLPAAVHQLRGDMAELKADVVELKAGQIRLETRVDGIATDLARMGGHVSRLVGADYEGYVASMARRAVRRELGVLDARPLSQPSPRDNTRLADLTADATQNGAITDPQGDDLERADMVLTGNNSEGNPVYVLAEISVTVQDDDVTRAKRRAAILQQASGIETIPATIGAAISTEGAQSAATENVAFILIEQDPEQAQDRPQETGEAAQQEPPGSSEDSH